MIQKKFIQELLRSDQTVFSFKDLVLKFRAHESESLMSKLSYYAKNGGLHHIRRGLYAKDAQYDRLELATKILTPSYISFETVLRSAGIIFQYYSQIFVASYQTRDIMCDGQVYSFRSIKSTILTNSHGVESHQNYTIASPERAFLDVVYRTKNYHFDNLDPLDWNKVYELLPIYGVSKAMKKRVEIYHNSYKKELGTKESVVRDSKTVCSNCFALLEN